MTKTGVIYMKLIVSYGEPTELDPVGCDGMYIESCEKTDEVNRLIVKNKALMDDMKKINWRAKTESLCKHLRDVVIEISDRHLQEETSSD